jgi:hypothetical protein
MKNYVPFLKLKVNEVAALAALSDDIKSHVIPFFDLPRKKEGMSSEELSSIVSKGVKSIAKHLKSFSAFFLDNFDIDDSIKINGLDNYEFVIDSLIGTNFIPVIGLDRTAAHNMAVFAAKKIGKITSDQVAIRLQPEDFDEFSLTKGDLIDLIAMGSGLFQKWTLILDNRLCIEVDAAKRSAKLLKFTRHCLHEFDFAKIIISGSSIPASIGDVIETNNEGAHSRHEIVIAQPVFHGITDERLTFGDYTIVSPLYSDIEIPPEAMRNVTAPKIAYSYDSVHYIFRGGRLSSHPRGNLQYNDLAAQLVSMAFYRLPPYSFGDQYLNEKANGNGSGVTPSSILKPTINAHMTYMFRDFKF